MFPGIYWVVGISGREATARTGNLTGLASCTGGGDWPGELHRWWGLARNRADSANGPTGLLALVKVGQRSSARLARALQPSKT